MNSNDKRKHPRIDSLNLSYICVDEEQNVIKHGIGRTLNVSQSGLLLETHFDVKSTHMLLLTIGFEEDLIDIKGKVVHSKPGKSAGTYEIGIEFVEIESSDKIILNQFIAAFHG